MQQDEALDLLKMGKNIFLTGAAGSGKTYLLNKYISYLKENNVGVAVTASTGIAATHLQGSTLHSWSGIGVKDKITRHDLETLLKTERVRRNYKKTKVLIIDEISMLHKHQLDMVDKIARYILNSPDAFGGMQIVLCGDFFQLPPVSSSVNEIQFAFEASVWSEADFHVCYLHEQHRQGNDPLLTILNDIRSGTAGEHTKVPLRTRYKKEPEGTAVATKLYSRNINVDAINDQALITLSGQEKIFKMTSNGFSSLVEGLKKSCLALEHLKLKIGAEVMFIRNDISGRYVNGTRCVVVGFDKKEGWPIVQTYTKEIIIARPEEWKDEDNGAVRATIMQVPLRLAWAITIHKSQGMTLDAAEIDLGDAFEPGMGYVALSRVRSLSGLKLMNLNEMALTVHPRILEQDKIFKDGSTFSVDDLKKLSETEKEVLQNKTLIDRFNGSKIKPTLKKKNNNKIPTHITTLAMLKENLSIESIAKKRELTVSTVITHIEKLQGLKLIDNALIGNLKDGIPKKDFDLIFAALEKSEDGSLTSLYNQFEGKYSYASIKIVRLFVGF
ncbi:MAG: AAA family ATPase [Gammaproteobacteria bacterium]|nr:AAA family ATPase [Gammaproteobacteria bacterium]